MLTDQEIELIAEKIVEKLRERLRRATASQSHFRTQPDGISG